MVKKQNKINSKKQSNFKKIKNQMDFVAADWQANLTKTENIGTICFHKFDALIFFH